MSEVIFLYGEFDSGSERTLAAWIRHASRTENLNSLLIRFLVADGLVTREISCPSVRNSPWKRGLIPHSIIDWPQFMIKGYGKR